MRVYLAAALVGLLGVVAIIGWHAGAGIVGTIPHSKSADYTLSVLPLFILIGFLAYHAGITQALFDAAKKWKGWMPGGLAIATVLAVAAFSAVSGASTTAAAVFARVAIPGALSAGYAKRLAAGVVCAGGTPRCPCSASSSSSSRPCTMGGKRRPRRASSAPSSSTCWRSSKA